MSQVLNDKRQLVHVDGKTSVSVDVVPGVPQGSA